MVFASDSYHPSNFTTISYQQSSFALETGRSYAINAVGPGSELVLTHSSLEGAEYYSNNSLSSVLSSDQYAPTHSDLNKFHDNSSTSIATSKLSAEFAQNNTGDHNDFSETATRQLPEREDYLVASPAPTVTQQFECHFQGEEIPQCTIRN
jgi:hypothetical protein